MILKTGNGETFDIAKNFTKTPSIAYNKKNDKAVPLNKVRLACCNSQKVGSLDTKSKSERFLNNSEVYAIESLSKPTGRNPAIKTSTINAKLKIKSFFDTVNDILYNQFTIRRRKLNLSLSFNLFTNGLSIKSL